MAPGNLTMREETTRPLLLFFLSTTLFSLSTAVDTLNPNQPLTDGQTLVSAGGSFALGFFSPANSKNRYVGIWYNKVSTQTVVWVANRRDPISDSTGSISVSGNGSLTITNNNSTVIWSTPATSATDPVAQLLDDGNFVVKEASGGGNPESFAWQSYDHPTDTLLTGMRMGLNQKSGLNRNLTAWVSDSDPSPGNYTMTIDGRGDPQFFVWDGSAPAWRSGPWIGVRFSGIPEMTTYSGMFTYDLVANNDEVSYAFHARDPSIISRLVMDQSGHAQRSIWIDTNRMWSIFWIAPKDQCDIMSPCGPYGVCNPNDSPICNCLEGFDPKYPTKWELIRDGTDGCVRRTALDCQNGTDGFVTVARAKLPDTSSATVDMSMNLDQCKDACLRNCSCKAYASANISESGSGCIIWTVNLIDLRVYTVLGQDLYVRLAAADLGSSSRSGKSAIATIMIVVGCCVSVGLLLSSIGYLLWKKKKRKAMLGTSFADNNNESDEGKDLELPLFDLDIVVAATDNFSMENKLGEGGFGPVYKGKLGGEQDVAVKRLSKTSLQGRDEFKNEVRLIAKLQHRNLVRLVGCCIHGGERMLVYEYMQNKSLDAFLFDKAKSTILDWETRNRIVLGIARGLLYLHQDSRLRIIHRDLKAGNILLDKEMNPKISDFGLARMFGGDETEANTLKVVGTYGYMSPEYAMHGIFSVKSDVFSFGVLVLEIISGKKNRGFNFSGGHENLLAYAWNLWKEGNGLELVDESMGYSFSMTEAFRCIKVGLLCVQEHPEDRPTMSSVVLMLGSEGAALLPPPKQPGFVSPRGPAETHSSTSKHESSSGNEISSSLFGGR